MTQRAFWQERVRQAVEARETPQQKKPRQAETKVTRTPYYAQNNGGDLMMTTRQELSWAHGRISELEIAGSVMVSDLAERNEELADQQLKIDSLEEEVEKLKDLLVAYKGEAAALRQHTEELEAKVERLKASS